MPHSAMGEQDPGLQSQPLSGLKDHCSASGALSRLLRGAAKILVRCCTLFGVLFLIISFTPLEDWWIRALSGHQYETSGDVLIVLGGSNLGGEFMGQGSYYRALYAVRAYRAGGFQHIIITGGSEPGTPIAVLMRDYIVAHNVPPEAVIVETASRTTRENAEFIRQLLAHFPTHPVLLTSDYHMFRARRTFAKLGIQVLPQPIADAEKRATRWYLRWPVFVDLVVETAKIGYYTVHGWI